MFTFLESRERGTHNINENSENSNLTKKIRFKFY